jgi:DsbC/DsbD-like thiol-disulfide interchange protein
MRFPVVLAAVLAVLPAAAAETDWTEIGPGVRARLIASDVLRSGGTTLIALEVEMPASTKTYWRIPGEAGIPTEIDSSASTGVDRATILWPYPTVDTSDGYLEYVYYGHLVLPIELAVVGDAPVLRAAITMGICDEVCVPAMMDIALPLDFTKPDPAQGLRISQAVAETPMAWSDPEDPIASVAWDGSANALAVGLGTPDVDASSVIADAGSAGPVFGAPQKSPDGRTVFLPLLGGGDPGGLVGEPIQLTFMTPMGAFETSRRVQPAADAAKH